MMLPETIRTIPRARTNLARFTSDKVSKQNVCPQGTCETWRRLGRLIKETAAYYFLVIILADIAVLADIRYVILKPITADTKNLPIITCIPIFII